MAKAVVAGAGIGGLASAIRLAVQGWETTVFEQSDKPGGKAGVINEEGFRFDTGPSLITMPFVLEELFNFAGEKLEDYVPLKRLDQLCRYFYEDGTVIDAYSDISRFAAEIEAKTSDTKADLLRYLDHSKKIYDLTSYMFLNKSFAERDTFLNLNALKTLLSVGKIDPFRTMHKANGAFFTDPKLVQLFDRYATYNGSSPYKAPATLNIIQHVEYNLGGYIAENGIYSIPEALYSLALKKGVKFRFNEKVDEIAVENSSVKGITTTNGFSPADVVISNVDVNQTYRDLLNDNASNEASKYERLEPSTSAFVFYWGVKGTYPELGIHNILFSEKYESEFRDLFEKKIVPDDPTVYVYISSKFRKGDALAGSENWFVMVNAPQNNGNDWHAEKMMLKNKILRKIKKVAGIDLKEKIIFESVMNPEDLERKTGSYKGSIYGISSNGRMAAFMRQQNRSRKYKGLYFAGGSAHPGGGIPLVLLSAKIATGLIEKYENL